MSLHQPLTKLNIETVTHIIASNPYRKNGQHSARTDLTAAAQETILQINKLKLSCRYLHPSIYLVVDRLHKSTFALVTLMEPKQSEITEGELEFEIGFQSGTSPGSTSVSMSVPAISPPTGLSQMGPAWIPGIHQSQFDHEYLQQKNNSLANSNPDPKNQTSKRVESTHTIVNIKSAIWKPNIKRKTGRTSGFFPHSENVRTVPTKSKKKLFKKSN